MQSSKDVLVHIMILIESQLGSTFRKPTELRLAIYWTYCLGKSFFFSVWTNMFAQYMLTIMTI